MELLDAILRSPAAFRLGWALVHSLWIATAFALLFTLVARLCRRSASMRYAFGCAALAATVGLSAGVFFLIPTPAGPAEDVGPQAVATLPAVGSVAPALPSEAPRAPERIPAPTSDAPAPVAAVPAMAEPSQPSWRADLTVALEPAMPWLAFLWVAGVAVLAAWQLIGWGQVGRLRRSATAVSDPTLRTMLAELAASLGVRRRVRLLESLRVHGPAVVGWLAPVILVPVGFATGLAPDQVRAVLAHELAHIRRYDYLVNLLQTLAETLLFYHPAVWYLSGRIRAEREHCADAVAVAAGAEPVRYAESLLHLARQPRPIAGRQAVAAGGRRRAELRDRISHLLGLNLPSKQGHTWPAAAAALLAVVLASLAVGRPAAESQPSDVEQLLAAVEAPYDRAGEAAGRLRNLHVVATRQGQAWSEVLGSWVNTPERMRLFAWFEDLADGRLRLDFDPDICTWRQGSRPYNETRWLRTYQDGLMTRVGFGYSSGRYVPGVRDKRRIGWDELPKTMRASLARLAPFPRSGEALYDDSVHPSLRDYVEAMRTGESVSVTRAEQDGRSLIRAVLINEVPKKGRIVGRTWFDPQRGHAVTRQEIEVNGKISNRYEVHAWKRLVPDLWLPTQWSFRNGRGRTIHRIETIEFFDPAQAEAIFGLQDIQMGGVYQRMPHGPDHPMGLADPVVSTGPAEPVPDLAHLTEPRLWQPEADGLFMDFDTGQAFSLPTDAAESPEQRRAWLQARGIDAIWQPKSYGGTGELFMLAGRVVLVDAKDWDSATATFIRNYWGELPLAAGPTAIQPDPTPAPAVLLFRTTDGRAGILHVGLDGGSSKSQLRVQYRLTQPMAERGQDKGD